MKLYKEKKQSREDYTIAADFSDNMNIDGGEDLVLGNTSVRAVDKNGSDVSNVILDQSTKEIGGAATGPGGASELGHLKIKIRGGRANRSPYLITFLSGLTTEGEKWEQDVQLTIKEVGEVPTYASTTSSTTTTTSL